MKFFVDSYGPAAQSASFSEIGRLLADSPVTSLGQQPATNGWGCGYRVVSIFLFLHFLVQKGCVEAYDVRTIPDLPHSWLHLCVSLLRVHDTVNTMLKGHKYRNDLHAAFEQAMTESPTTMGPVLQLLNSQIENPHHPRKNDPWCVSDEVCGIFNETHNGEEK